MMQYSTTHRLFPGEKKTRYSTVQTRRKRRIFTGEIEYLDNVTYYIFDSEQNIPSTRSGSVRLCGYLTHFERHVEYRAQRKNPRPCEVCGDDSYTVCGLCHVPLHFFPKIGFQKKKTCFLKYHSNKFFGCLEKPKTNGRNQSKFGPEFGIR